MEFLDFVLGLVLILVSGLLIWLKMASSNAIKLQEFAEKARLSEIRRKASSARYEQHGSAEVGAWVSELAQVAGFDVEQLFQDEIPPEVAKLLPLAKGFLESGGLQKLLGSTGNSSPQEAGGLKAPGDSNGCI